MANTKSQNHTEQASASYRFVSASQHMQTLRPVRSFAVRTGFDTLDKMLDGGVKDGITVLGAMPGLGKTTFVLQLAYNVAAKGTPVLFFSLEMTAFTLIAKSITRECFLERRYTPDQQDKTLTAIELMSSEQVLSFFSSDGGAPAELPAGIGAKDAEVYRTVAQTMRRVMKNLYIIDKNDQKKQNAGKANAAFTAADIAEITEAFIGSHCTDSSGTAEGLYRRKPLVIVDYLQILDRKKGEILTDKQAVEASFKELEALSKQGVPVILISSINRGSYETDSRGRRKSSLSMNSFKETGLIEYSADTLLAIDFVNKNASPEEEKAKDPREISIEILKQRMGAASGSVQFYYYPKYDAFVDSRSAGRVPSRSAKASRADQTEKSDPERERFMKLDIKSYP